MIKKIIPVLLLAIGFSGCKLASVSYSFTGAQISPDVKTFSVDYFSNKTAFAPGFGIKFYRSIEKLPPFQNQPDRSNQQ